MYIQPRDFVISKEWPIKQHKQFKWALANRSGKILIESPWLKGSYKQDYQTDPISWTKSLSDFKNDIYYVKIFSKQKNVVKLELFQPSININCVSYLFARTTSDQLIGLLVETFDKKIEMLVNGNVSSKKKEV